MLLTSMGMRPIGFARRKHMGATDSCRGQEEVSARKAMYTIDALSPRKVAEGKPYFRASIVLT